MSTTLKIRDETTFSLGGDDDRDFTLDVADERITVRDLIRARVYREVRDYNLDQPEYFHGLIQPSDAERSLNGFKMRRRRRIDPESSSSWPRDRSTPTGSSCWSMTGRWTSSRMEIEIRPDTTVTFLKLVPLVGG